MPNDPIVDETRKLRDAYAQRFNYDLKAICQDLRRQQADAKRHGKSQPEDSASGWVPGQDKPSSEELIG